MNQQLISSADLDAVMESAVATGLLSAEVTYQALPVAAASFGVSGSPQRAEYANVAGLVDIPCQVAPIGLLTMVLHGTERKTLSEILSKQPLHILHDGYYPEITTAMQTVVTVSGGSAIEYDVESVEHDSQQRMTRVLITRNTL